jgi:hypothetical protein
VRGAGALGAPGRYPSDRCGEFDQSIAVLWDGATMDPSKLFRTLGAIAGLAGIALGVVLLIFQGVLATKFLPSTGLVPGIRAE